MFQPPVVAAQTQAQPQTQQTPAKAAGTRNTPWPTAEEEKLRLFNEAQAAAAKNQALESYSPPSSLHGRSTSDLGRAPEVSRSASASASASVPAPAPAPVPAPAPAPVPVRNQNQNQNHVKPITAADLYAQAISARNESLSKQQHALPTPKPSFRVVVPQYRTAEQEKAALRRYEEAKMAVDRLQRSAAAGLGESEGGGGSGGSGSVGVPMDPPDALQSLRGTDDLPPPDLPPPFESSSNTNAVPASHGGQKEQLRREYERQDAARNRRPTPAPPSASSSRRVLTAAEEKALLRARYAAEEAEASPPYVNGNGNANGHHHVNNVNYTPHRPGTAQSASQPASRSPTPEPPATPPPPPPLMPRPPVEYIQETQEEDARVSLFAMNGVLPPDHMISRSTSLTLSLAAGVGGGASNAGIPVAAVASPMYSPVPNSAATLQVRPFSPFSAAFEQSPGLSLPGPPPPLPPKPDGE
jgi:hypothetical protein